VKGGCCRRIYAGGPHLYAILIPAFLDCIACFTAGRHGFFGHCGALTNMIDLSTAAVMHRIPQPAFWLLQRGDAGRELMVLPLRLPMADPLTYRRALHAILGNRLAGYCIAIDTARRWVRVDLNLRRCDLAQCMRLLATGLRSAEFGQVVRHASPARPADGSAAGAAP